MFLLYVYPGHGIVDQWYIVIFQDKNGIPPIWGVEELPAFSFFLLLRKGSVIYLCRTQHACVR